MRPPGPLEEKDATTGAGLKSLISVAGSIVAVGFLCESNNLSKYSVFFFHVNKLNYKQQDNI